MDTLDDLFDRDGRDRDRTQGRRSGLGGFLGRLFGGGDDDDRYRDRRRRRDDFDLDFD